MKKEYNLIFVRGKGGKDLGFFGLYWNKEDFDRQYAYAKKTFAEVQTVKGVVPESFLTNSQE